MTRTGSASTWRRARRYQIDLEGSPTGRGTLEDPLLKLFESGDSIALDDDGGAALNSRVIYAPTTTGTYYIEAIEAGGGASSVTTGTYTLSVRDITPPPDDPLDDSGNVPEGDTEDLPADTTTTGEVEVGGSVTGNITSHQR